MQGSNFVELVGVMRYPNLRETRNGNLHFQGKIAIPFPFVNRATGETEERQSYVKISAWGEMAQELSRVPENTWLRAQGAVNERSYEGKCKSCENPDKKYWTDILVDNYVLIENQ